MSQSADSIIAYLELLHANRHLIANTYCNGGVSMNEDNQRRVRQLQQHRVLIPYFQDDFRLSPSLGQHLDEVFQRQRSYAVGANFGELINRLSQLIVEYVNASHESRLEDQEMYAADFDVSVFELASLVSNQLLNLRVITENRFANVRTFAEKQRQNTFYLDRAKKIGEVIFLLGEETLLGTLEGSTLLEPLFVVYQHQISARLQEWRATHLDITAVLKAFLHRLRQVEPEIRRLRAFAHYLRKNPDYQPPEVDSIQALPSWSSRFAGLRLKVHPDLSSSQTRDALADVAKAIPATRVTIVKERVAGHLIGNGSEDQVSVLQPKPVQLAFHRYLEAASTAISPVSALRWKRQQQAFDELEDEAWLLYTIHAIQMLGKGPKGRIRHFQVNRIEASVGHPRSGNIVVTDIELWKKT